MWLWSTYQVLFNPSANMKGAGFMTPCRYLGSEAEVINHIVGSWMAIYISGAVRPHPWWPDEYLLCVSHFCITPLRHFFKCPFQIKACFPPSFPLLWNVACFPALIWLFPSLRWLLSCFSILPLPVVCVLWPLTSGLLLAACVEAHCSVPSSLDRSSLSPIHVSV